MALTVKEALKRLRGGRNKVKHVTSRGTLEGRAVVVCYRCGGAPGTLIRLDDFEVQIRGLTTAQPEALYECKGSCHEQQTVAVKGYVRAQQRAQQDLAAFRAIEAKTTATRLRLRALRRAVRPFPKLRA